MRQVKGRSVRVSDPCVEISIFNLNRQALDSESHSIPKTVDARSLPEYANPPVVEVACSIQFNPIGHFDSGVLAALWDAYRERYSRIELQPPLAPTSERFEKNSLRFQLSVPPNLPRLWFLNDDGTRLLQVQRDHLVVNWRKLDTEVEYPRYSSIRAILDREYETFRSILGSRGLDATAVVQTELTYVNHINARGPDDSRMPLSEIVRNWTGEPAQRKLPELEEVAFQARYIMRRNDKPAGRLHIMVEPQIYVRNGAPLYSLTLVARTAPLSPDLLGALRALDEGHEVIVEGFTAITTDKMHALWERKQ